MSPVDLLDALAAHWAYWGAVYMGLAGAYAGYRLDRYLETP